MQLPYQTILSCLSGSTLGLQPQLVDGWCEQEVSHDPRFPWQLLVTA